MISRSLARLVPLVLTALALVACAQPQKRTDDTAHASDVTVAAPIGSNAPPPVASGFPALPSAPSASSAPVASSAPAPSASVPPAMVRSACTADTDCRLFDDYCMGCDCRALGAKTPDPTCKGPGVRCFRAPCGGLQAACEKGTCVTRSAAPTR